MVRIPNWPKVPIWQIPRERNLDTTKKLLEALGNPQDKIPPTIHIAGTNGKGSSVAMLKSIYNEAGYKIHTYTSPHLIEFNERIHLAGERISDDHIYSLLDRVKFEADRLGLEPSFFEGTTVAAFLAFSETDADILLLETGLGGRLDCTNVITNPILTLITPISYDHIEHLGNDILQIASEKAGIIKKKVPCVISMQLPQIYDVFFAKCDEQGAPSFCFEYDYSAHKQEQGFKYTSNKYNLDLPFPNLIGDHQILNASAVIASVMLLNEKFKVTAPQISTGITNIHWPGRLQKIDKYDVKRLAGDNIDIYLDGAHNNAGAVVLANWIKENVEGEVHMILGMTRNRDVVSFCNNFKDMITSGVSVSVESEPSSYSASVLAEYANKSDISFTSEESLESAIKRISLKKKKDPITIIVTGSLFLIADFLKLIRLE